MAQHYQHIIISLFLDCALPTLRATRRTNLALLATAVLSRRQLSLSCLARAIACSTLPVSASHRHNKKRLFRFLSNDKVDTLSAQTALILAGMRVSPSFRRRVCSWGNWEFCIRDWNTTSPRQNCLSHTSD